VKLVEFFQINKLLADNQYGFRKGLSTEKAINNFLENVLQCFQDGSYYTASFLDLRKAFNCISHDIPLRKLFFQYNVSPHITFANSSAIADSSTKTKLKLKVCMAY
jgi:hypothetical protein